VAAKAAKAAAVAIVRESIIFSTTFNNVIMCTRIRIL